MTVLRGLAKFGRKKKVLSSCGKFECGALELRCNFAKLVGPRQGGDRGVEKEAGTNGEKALLFVLMM